MAPARVSADAVTRGILLCKHRGTSAKVAREASRAGSLYNSAAAAVNAPGPAPPQVVGGIVEPLAGRPLSCLDVLGITG
jgi:hypothetical protein